MFVSECNIGYASFRVVYISVFLVSFFAITERREKCDGSV